MFCKDLSPIHSNSFPIHVLAALRARWANLPVVFSTAHVNEAFLRETIGPEPLVEVLNKPYRFSELLRALTNVINARNELHDG